MSLNVENLFVKCDQQLVVAELVDSYWRKRPPQIQPDWGLPTAYDRFLANQTHRKVAISRSLCGWVALIESKEVIDFGLANVLSENLQTSVLAIQIYEVCGAAGYALAVDGQLLESYFAEQDSDPVATIHKILERHKVPFGPTLFREAVDRLRDGWMIGKKS